MNAALKMTTQIQEFDTLPSHIIEKNCIAIFEDLETSQVIELAARHGVQHIVQKKARNLEREIFISETMLTDPKRFMADPMSLILPHPTHSFRASCEANEHKRMPLMQLESFIKTLPGSKSILGELMAASEELFTNASKNTGEFYKKLAPTNLPQVQGQLSLIANCNQDTIVVGCVDSFGLLDIPTLVNKLFGCFDVGVAGSIQHGNAGAGIGTFLILNSATNLYIGVEKNNKTMVLCSFPLGMRTKNIQELPKNLHLLTLS